MFFKNSSSFKSRSSILYSKRKCEQLQVYCSCCCCCCCCCCGFTRLFVDGITLPRIFIKKLSIYFCIFDSHIRVAKCSCFVQRSCRQHTSSSVPAVNFSTLQVSRSSLHCQICWLFSNFCKQIQFWFFRFFVFVD